MSLMMILLISSSFIPTDLIASVIEQSSLENQYFENEPYVKEEENLKNNEEETALINEEETVLSNDVETVDTKEIVVIPDANLEAELRLLLNIPAGDMITKSKLETLTGKVDFSNKGITDLEGIQYAKNITKLLAGSNPGLVNQIPELCGPGGITNLKKVNFSRTSITSPKFLSQCSELTVANFYGAKLKDVIGLENSPKLYDINIAEQVDKQLKSLLI